MAWTRWRWGMRESGRDESLWSLHFRFLGEQFGGYILNGSSRAADLKWSVSWALAVKNQHSVKKCYLDCRTQNINPTLLPQYLNNDLLVKPCFLSDCWIVIKRRIFGGGDEDFSRHVWLHLFEWIFSLCDNLSLPLYKSTSEWWKKMGRAYSGSISIETVCLPSPFKEESLNVD